MPYFVITCPRLVLFYDMAIHPDFYRCVTFRQPSSRNKTSDGEVPISFERGQAVSAAVFTH